MSGEDQELQSYICRALGEASALFMSQECKGTKIVMPDQELGEIATRTAEEYLSADSTLQVMRAELATLRETNRKLVEENERLEARLNQPKPCGECRFVKLGWDNASPFCNNPDSDSDHKDVRLRIDTCPLWEWDSKVDRTE